ncbi:phage tail assembly chaperone [Pasteurella multocida]
MERLIDHVREEFKLNKPVKNSDATLREHLQAVWEQTGIKPDELNTPEPPSGLMYLFSYFNELSLSRQYGMAVNPISYSDILAWSILTKVSLAAWEIEVIKQIDIVYLNSQTET